MGPLSSFIKTLMQYWFKCNRRLTLVALRELLQDKWTGNLTMNASTFQANVNVAPTSNLFCRNFSDSMWTLFSSANCWFSSWERRGNQRKRHHLDISHWSSACHRPYWKRDEKGRCVSSDFGQERTWRLVSEGGYKRKELYLQLVHQQLLSVVSFFLRQLQNILYANNLWHLFIQLLLQVFDVLVHFLRREQTFLKRFHSFTVSNRVEAINWAE